MPEITLKSGRKVEIEIEVARAEPDVGIMSDYIDSWLPAKGEEPLTEAEEAEVDKQLETLTLADLGIDDDF